jgi:hypothetical protein
MARGLGTRGRFAVAYLLLGAAAGTGLGALIVLLQRPGPAPPPAWSSWRPTATAVQDRVVQIADHVGTRYKLPGGDQLAQVTIGGPATGKKLRAIVIPNVAKPQTLSDFQRYDWSKSTAYALCGTGGNCKIGEGSASQARGAVIRREALELALYTLKYAEPIDNVLVFVPPGPKEKKITSTLFFRRSDLSSSLSKPLRKTLPRRPPFPGEIAATEKARVDELAGNLYTYAGIVATNGYGNVLGIAPTASVSR